MCSDANRFWNGFRCSTDYRAGNFKVESWGYGLFRRLLKRRRVNEDIRVSHESLRDRQYRSHHTALFDDFGTRY